MSDEEVYKIINKEPIEYENLLKDIKTRADSNKNLDGKSECKLLMRYLKKQWQEIERLNNIIKELDKQNGELGAELSIIKDTIDKTNWWLEQMLKQATNNETKAIINGVLELLLDKVSDKK